MKKAYIITEQQVKELLTIAQIPLFMMENMKVGGEVHIEPEGATVKFVDNKYILIWRNEYD